jgi:hypothetical protein
MQLCIEGLHERDTFNLMTFSGSTSYCFERPVPNTAGNRESAWAFLANLRGSGGTEMMSAIEGCLSRQEDPERVRVVCFMTDGCVGNDFEIIAAVKRSAGVARVFAIGAGTSVNRFLLEGIARAGRGEVQFLLNERDAAGVAERFYERVRTPVLTDVKRPRISRGASRPGPVRRRLGRQRGGGRRRPPVARQATAKRRPLEFQGFGRRQRWRCQSQRLEFGCRGHQLCPATVPGRGPDTQRGKVQAERGGRATLAGSAAASRRGSVWGHGRLEDVRPCRGNHRRL